MTKSVERRSGRMRLILAITGASGVELAVRLLDILKRKNMSVDVIVSDSALRVCEYELRMSPKDFMEAVGMHASKVYGEKEIWAPPASGTYDNKGMIILPCSMKTLAMIAHGYDANLIARAASVCLKEKRKLVLCVRETPLRQAHLRNMLLLAEEGATILPLMMSFYGKKKESKDKYEFMINNILGKILNMFDIDHDDSEWRWES